VGENAQGKTNFLEALYILSYGTSFRTHRLEELKKFQTKECALNAVLQDDQKVSHTVHFHYKGIQKEIKINQNKILDRKHLLHHNPTIIFSYDDYKIVTGGHSIRRVFFDQIECLKSIYYIDLIRNYKRILEQRNKALKERNSIILDTYNYQLAKYGLEIMSCRKKTVDDSSREAQHIFDNASPDSQKLEFIYHPTWNM